MKFYREVDRVGSKKDFVIWLFEGNKNYIRKLLFIYMIIFCAFALFDYYNTKTSFFSVLIIRLSIGFPALLFAFICTFITKLHPYIRFINATALFMMNVTVSLMYLYILPDENAFDGYYSGLIITMATIGLSMSSFRLSSIYITVSAVSFIAISYFIHHLHINYLYLFFKSSIYIIVSAGLFIVSSKVIEQFSLKLYYSQKNILHKMDEITDQKEILEKLNHTKDRFFRIISHDLRSPFTTLIGYFDILLRDNKTEFKVNKVDIEKIYLHSRRTYNLLNNLLNWSKTQLNQYSFEKKEYLLNDILSENNSLYKGIANQKKITIKHAFPEDTVVFCDKEMIMVIVRNLIFNAIKFTRLNGQIIIKGIPLPNNKIELSVIDNGIGISEDEIKSILNPNEHLTTEGTSNEIGSGIGLIICHDLLQKHHSKLQIESNKNEGSKLFFILPNQACTETIESKKDDSC